MMNYFLILLSTLGLFMLFLSIGNYSVEGTIAELANSTLPETTAGSNDQIVLVIRGIDSFISPNLIALVYTGDDVGSKIVNLNNSQAMSNQEEDLLDPQMMIEVPVDLNMPIVEGKEVMACVLELGVGPLDSITVCNVAFANTPSTGGPQKIIINM